MSQQVSLSSADQLHRFASARDLRYHRVDHLLLRSFDSRARRFFGRLGDETQDDVWHPFVRLVSRYRRAAIGVPLPFDDPAIRPEMTVDATARFLARMAPLHPSSVAEATVLKDALYLLAQSHDGPLLDVVDAILREADGPSAVIVRDSRLVEAVRDRLRSRGRGNFDVVAGHDLGAGETYQQLLLAGPAYWYADHIFTAPPAPVVQVISYRWFRSNWNSAGGFIQPTSGRFGEGREDQESDDAEVDEPWPELNWGRIFERADGNAGHDAEPLQPELVEARVFSLFGGLAVFLEEEDGSKSLVIDLDAEDEGRVQRIPTRDILPGMFVLLRTEGGGDYVAAVANQILDEHATRCRGSQRRWKDGLRAEIRSKGLLRTSLDLLDLGSIRAEEQNLRNWASESTIRPQDPADFNAIMRLIGLEDEAGAYRADMDRIFHAHLLAGQRIRRQLMERVRAMDTSQLQKAGRAEFMLPDVEGGRLSALKVEGKSPTTYELSSARVGRLFEMED